MKTFSSIYDFHSAKKTVVTLGTFDGVHIGHQKILDKLLVACKAMDAESLVLTFFPHPRMVLKQDEGIALLNTLDEKTALLRQYGLDNLVVHEFDKAFSQLSAEDFVKKVLVDQFQVCKVIIGYDHRFGKNRTADITDLKRFGLLYGFEVEEISAQEIGQVSVSSTKIRKALEEGNIKRATEFLGHCYSFTGAVVTGKKLGRELGFPTANIEIPEVYKLIPKNGVYVVSSEIEGKQTLGMMSIGYNPTFQNHPHTIEVHYLDFDEDLYGKSLKVDLHEKIRDEEKFDNLEDLICRIQEDELFTRSYFKKI